MQDLKENFLGQEEGSVSCLPGQPGGTPRIREEKIRTNQGNVHNGPDQQSPREEFTSFRLLAPAEKGSK